MSDYKQQRFEDIYELGVELGSGQFAKVRRCVHRTTGEAFAAKFIRKAAGGAGISSKRRMSMKDIHREVTVLRTLNHENIVALRDVYESQREVILLLELVSGGELFEYLAEREKVNEDEAVVFIKQILDGLKHMHALDIVHLDLKPENLMLESKDSHRLKIIDFGLSQKLDRTLECRRLAGTPEFCAPEQINFDPLLPATDMWAVGVITYILLSGSSPFLGDTKDSTHSNVIAVNYDLNNEHFTTTSDLAKEFITDLLKRDPKDRLSVEDCLVHPWIQPREEVLRRKRRSSSIDIENLKSFVARRRWQDGAVGVEDDDDDSDDESLGSDEGSDFTAESSRSVTTGGSAPCTTCGGAFLPGAPLLLWTPGQAKSFSPLNVQCSQSDPVCVTARDNGHGCCSQELDDEDDDDAEEAVEEQAGGEGKMTEEKTLEKDKPKSDEQSFPADDDVFEPSEVMLTNVTKRERARVRSSDNTKQAKSIEDKVAARQKERAVCKSSTDNVQTLERAGSPEACFEPLIKLQVNQQASLQITQDDSGKNTLEDHDSLEGDDGAYMVELVKRANSPEAYLQGEEKKQMHSEEIEEERRNLQEFAVTSKIDLNRNTATGFKAREEIEELKRNIQEFAVTANVDRNYDRNAATGMTSREEIKEERRNIQEFAVTLNIDLNNMATSMKAREEIEEERRNLQEFAVTSNIDLNRNTATDSKTREEIEEERRNIQEFAVTSKIDWNYNRNIGGATAMKTREEIEEERRNLQEFAVSANVDIKGDGDAAESIHAKFEAENRNKEGFPVPAWAKHREEVEEERRNVQEFAVTANLTVPTDKTERINVQESVFTENIDIKTEEFVIITALDCMLAREAVEKERKASNLARNTAHGKQTKHKWAPKTREASEEDKRNLAEFAVTANVDTQCKTFAESMVIKSAQELEEERRNLQEFAVTANVDQMANATTGIIHSESNEEEKRNLQEFAVTANTDFQTNFNGAMPDDDVEMTEDYRFNQSKEEERRNLQEYAVTANLDSDIADLSASVQSLDVRSRQEIEEERRNIQEFAVTANVSYETTAIPASQTREEMEEEKRNMREFAVTANVDVLETRRETDSIPHSEELEEERRNLQEYAVTAQLEENNTNVTERDIFVTTRQELEEEKRNLQEFAVTANLAVDNAASENLVVLTQQELEEDQRNVQEFAVTANVAMHSSSDAATNVMLNAAAAQLVEDVDQHKDYYMKAELEGRGEHQKKENSPNVEVPERINVRQAVQEIQHTGDASKARNSKLGDDQKVVKEKRFDKGSKGAIGKALKKSGILSSPEIEVRLPEKDEGESKKDNFARSREPPQQIGDALEYSDQNQKIIAQVSDAEAEINSEKEAENLSDEERREYVSEEEQGEIVFHEEREEIVFHEERGEIISDEERGEYVSQESSSSSENDSGREMTKHDVSEEEIEESEDSEEEQSDTELEASKVNLLQKVAHTSDVDDEEKVVVCREEARSPHQVPSDYSID